MGAVLSTLRLEQGVVLIQGPPGTGKTTVAAAIGFGFVHQCRNSKNSNSKVLACAFSNVGADNLAESLLKLGLKVIRVGKASATSEHLWEHTLDAAVANDPEAQKAQVEASLATVNLKPKRRSDTHLDRINREVATLAVKASIHASRVAATKALRECDVIVSTSIGAADSRLLASCGIYADEEEDDRRLKKNEINSKLGNSKRGAETPLRRLAPDNEPPISLPYVIVDEACQSVEPANLVPITATDSCRAVVLLGDPCQLPPTVKGSIGISPLATSLMARLAIELPHPVVFSAPSLPKSERDESFLNIRPTHQAVSHIKYKNRNNHQEPQKSYRKKFSGSLLLSVQYRMHPSIAAFSSAVFYDGLLSTPFFLAAYRPFPKALCSRLPLQNKSGFNNVNFCHYWWRE